MHLKKRQLDNWFKQVFPTVVDSEVCELDKKKKWLEHAYVKKKSTLRVWIDDATVRSSPELKAALLAKPFPSDFHQYTFIER